LIQHLPLVSWSGKDLKAKINADSSNNHLNDRVETDGRSNRRNRSRRSNNEQQTNTNENANTNRSSPLPPSYTEKIHPTSSKNNKNDTETSDNPQTSSSPLKTNNRNEVDSCCSTSKINPISSPDFNDYEDSQKSLSSESEDYECTICLEDFMTGQKIRYLPCMHYYHAGCIDAWLMKSFTCPRCMASVDSGIMNSFAQQLS